MTVATGFQRLGIVLALALVVGGGAVLALNLVVSADAVRDKVRAEIRAVTGLEPEIGGAGAVSLFPSGHVSFADVAMGERAAPALRAERLVANLKFLPLLIGRVEVADLTLERPQIALTFAADGLSNWAGLIARLERRQASGAPAPMFSEIRIRDGSIVVSDARHNFRERFDAVEMSLAWPFISRSFGATGRFRWRGEALDASIAIGDFAAALAGDRSGLKLRVAGASAKAAFDGHFGMKPTLKIEGKLTADTASLRDTLVWAGQRPLPGGGFGRFEINAQANVVGGTIALSGVNLILDGNRAEGVLTFATDGRKTLQGTLAAGTLDLTSYISTARLLAASGRAWSDSHISLDGLTGFDVDLRLSAANVVLSGTRLGRTAVGASLRGGHLNVAIGESQAFNGIIRGSFAIANLETGVDIKSQIQFVGVDLAACLGELLGLKRLEGKGNVALAVNGSGDSVMALTRTLTGSASVTGENGAMTGLNVEQLLRRLERSPLSGSGAFRTGRTAYDKLTVNLRIAEGIVTIDDARVTGPSVLLALTGTAQIPSRELSLKGTAGLLTDGATAPKFELPFFVEGSWDDPIMLPDAQMLIRRSGAAAPLLNAVRDKEARDALRSAIKRLTVGAPANTAAQGVAPQESVSQAGADGLGADTTAAPAAVAPPAAQ